MHPKWLGYEQSYIDNVTIDFWTLRMSNSKFHNLNCDDSNDINSSLTFRFSAVFPSGTGGRWGFGVVILIYLIVYNENGGPTTFVATLLASMCALFSGEYNNPYKNN